ncbi:MAG: hypothetical protein GWN18_02820, partial [Thermoplasmata archaeon]|nr:hypothetical protein [Thermoplasmata archaeon]NIS10943.1 hypothetical protein [Thermoplasmata archaeon]NIS18879.1 hypothetical protein [Thermoplasmata archaeon]NIT75913.1 hypothetical protein [Thermoplasmata archaeon]NIU48033.1 hypothetical protein [Thermoplasmata archaeon]
MGTGDPAGSVERLDVTPLDVLDTRSPELPGLRPCFIENRGQLDDGEVAYYAPGGSVSVGFGPGWAAYAVREADGQHVTVFRTTFAGCEPVTPTARDPEAHPTSYFIGPDESEWVVGARSYRTVLYQDLYEGIDVAYYFEDGCLKYDVVVGPGSDPAAYRLEYEGVATLEVDGRSGDLLVGAGGQVLTEAAPRAFQVMDGRRVEVEAAFQLGDGGTLGFAVGDHDPSIPLVIDPGLAFSTYLGGTKEDYLNDMAVDEGGHMLLT